MHRSKPSTSGGLFQTGNIFGSSKSHNHSSSSSKSQSTTRRPSTSGGGGSSKDTVESAFSRKPSFSFSPNPKSFRGRVNVDGNTTTSNLLPDSQRPGTSNQAHGYPVPSLATRQRSIDAPSGPHSKEDFTRVVNGADAELLSHARVDSNSSTAAFSDMLVRPGTSYSNLGAVGGGPPQQPPSPTLENITFQHIQETSSKRISTLDYLRKAHEGRVYWFNTLLFNKPDLQRMPYFESRKLARRATNYLLLGLSLPTVLDLNSSNPTEFLKTLNALLAEFESFQSIHPPDGSSSLSRARFPQMFKRATTGGGKGRRASSAAEIGLPMGNDSSDQKLANNAGPGGASGSSAVFTMGETDLLPGEEYTHLLTPSLPFDPDFYETFATLCDVLIDCYTRLMSLVSGPKECSPHIAEMFTKADARVRKIIVQGVVKEFEDSSRAGVKGEVAGVGRVVLGGLM